MINVKCNFGAIYTVEVLDENGIVKRKSAPSNNLILQTGYANMFADTGAIMSRLWVGTGSTPVSVTDAGLASPLTSTTSTESGGSGAVDNASGFYVWGRTVYVFNTGAVVGNITEVGLSTNSSPYIFGSRALLRDSNGNPTAITVLSDEILRVTVELRWYPDTSESVSTLNLVDGSGAVVSAHTITIKAGHTGSNPYPRGHGLYRLSGSTATYSSASNLNWGSRVRGSTDGMGTVSNTRNIEEGSLTTRGRHAVNSGNGTIYGGFISVSGVFDQAGIGWKFKIEPPIPKTNQEVFELDIKVFFALNQ